MRNNYSNIHAKYYCSCEEDWINGKIKFETYYRSIIMCYMKNGRLPT